MFRTAKGGQIPSRWIREFAERQPACRPLAMSCLGQASDLISECLRLTNCRPDGMGRTALGK